MSDLARAFPSHNDADKYYNWIEAGISIRDYFAAKAMQGLLSADPEHDFKNGAICEILAIASYNVADAMLKERAKDE